jgi:hypothetical protein
VFWEDRFVILLVLLEGALQPREAATSVLEFGIWLPRLKDFLVRSEHVVGEPHLDIHHGMVAHGFNGEASLVEQLLVLDALCDIFELFKDLDTELVAQMVPLLLEAAKLIYV